MLYKIIIENFFSIADTQELSFEILGNAPDLACFKHPRADDQIRLPVVIGFFGANASGKSTILRAVASAAIFALYSFEWGDQALNLLFQAYRQKDWWGKPSKITIEFDSQLNQEALPSKFRYELHIAHQANNFTDKIVSYEALSYAPLGKFRFLFKRDHQNIHFGEEFGISNTNDPRKESVRPNASVISTLAKLNHPLSIFLSKLISTLQTNINVMKVQPNPNIWLSAYAKDKLCLERLNRELRRLDVGIESMSIEQGNYGLFAKFIHAGLDECIFFEEESQGTQRFIVTFLRLYYALETGGIALIDEIDSDSHPLLLPEFFRWFNDPQRNKYGAQLFFTAHNPTLLDDLEKEQVFFTEKPYGKPSIIYGARDIEGLRREPSLMKKYLSGALGAVPHIG